MPRRKVTRPTPIFKLPPELFRMVDDYLEYADATCLALTCKELYQSFSRFPIPRLSPYTEQREFRVKDAKREDLLPVILKAIDVREDHYHKVETDRAELLPRLRKKWMKVGLGEGQSYCSGCFRFHIPRPGVAKRRRCYECANRIATHPLQKAKRHVCELRRWLSCYKAILPLLESGVTTKQTFERSMATLESEDNVIYHRKTYNGKC